MEKFRIVLGCHPGEMVAKKVGVMVASSLAQRGHKVGIIRMPEVMMIGRKPVPCWEAFATPGMLNRRKAEEDEIARSAPGVLTVTFHDGPIEEDACRIFKPTLEGGRLLEVEVGAPHRQVADPMRRYFEWRMERDGMDEKERAYVTHEADPHHPHSVARLRTSYANRVADMILEVSKKDPPWMEMFED